VLAHAQRATERSFEKLYRRRHVHAVYRYALAVLHNEADAEDVTQTTFLYNGWERMSVAVPLLMLTHFVAVLGLFHAPFGDTIEAGWRVVIRLPHPRVGMYRRDG
jgi:hypothetical protein